MLYILIYYICIYIFVRLYMCVYMIVTSIIPISQVRKLRHKEVKKLPQVVQLVNGTRGIQPHVDDVWVSPLNHQTIGMRFFFFFLRDTVFMALDYCKRSCYHCFHFLLCHTRPWGKCHTALRNRPPCTECRPFMAPCLH